MFIWSQLDRGKVEQFKGQYSLLLKYGILKKLFLVVRQIDQQTSNKVIKATRCQQKNICKVKEQK